MAHPSRAPHILVSDDQTAIAASLGLRTYAELTESDMPGRIRLVVPDVSHVDCNWDAAEVFELCKRIGACM